MTRWIRKVAVAGAWSVACVGLAQNPNPNPQPNQQNPNAVQNQNQNQNPNQNANGQLIRGTVVRVEGQDRVVVRTNENREVTLVTNPQTRFTINGRQSRIADLRAGVQIRANYQTQGDRWIASTVLVGNEAPGGGNPNANPNDNANNRQFRGRVTRVNATATPAQIVAKSQDGRELTLFVQNNAQILHNGTAVKAAEIPVGSVIQTQYVQRDNHLWVQQVTVLAADSTDPRQVPPAQPGTPPVQPGAPVQPAQPNDQPGAGVTQIEGKVVRIVGQNQVVIRTSDNKEMAIDLTPQTTYLFDNQPTQLREFQPGREVRIQYSTRDRRPIASRLFGIRRR